MAYENEPYSPVQDLTRDAAGHKIISRRAYNFALAAFMIIGFVVMGVSAMFTSTPQFYLWLAQFGLAFIAVYFIASIGGLVLMSMGKSKESLGMSLVGYILFVLSFGVTASVGLMTYDLGTISNALLATAGIMVVFGTLGVMFPEFFQKIAGVLCACLLALIIVELVFFFMGISQTWIDMAVVLVFCGFIGYDSYRASYDTPTIPNAIFNASQLFVDIINVFLRLLQIFGNRD